MSLTLKTDSLMYSDSGRPRSGLCGMMTMKRKSQGLHGRSKCKSPLLLSFGDAC